MDIKKGDVLSRTQYYIVNSPCKNDDFIELQNEDGFVFHASKSIVDAEMESSSYFTETKEVTRTQLAEILMEARDACFCVTFTKQKKQADLVKQLTDLSIDEDTSKRDLNKIAKELMKGEERTLTGYLVATEPLLGRTRVIDLHVPADQNRCRLVDHRTITSIVIRGTFYKLK